MPKAMQVREPVNSLKLMEAPPENFLTLLEISKSIASHKNLSDLFHDLSGRLQPLLNFHFFALVLYDAPRNVMRLHILETTGPGNVKAGGDYPMEESPSAMAWETQRPFIVEDTEQETRFPRVMRELRQENVRSFCSLPLTSAHRRLGTINFGSREPRAFQTEDLEFPKLVAAQVAVAVDNALNFEEAQALHHQLARDRDRLQLLLDLNNRVVSNLELRELFSAISSGIRRVLQCDYAGLSLPHPERERMMKVYALDFPEGKGLLHEELTIPFEGSCSARAYLSGKPSIINSKDPYWQTSPLAKIRAQEGLQCLCFIPLVKRGRTIGVLNLGRLRDESFTEEDVYFLSQIAGQIAIGVENALDFEKVRESRQRLAEEKEISPGRNSHRA